ncbi:alpha-tocopherol transfer protein-like [Cylas formicarius]|uniref:alpha-tocopherol transfer protein-like n=1 Tax=Cylas formicarius TaxID=197179 RepID=UPI0029583975|nr:alpha-tocopherol transfer protein-like [Cylas formicarius]
MSELTFKYSHPFLEGLKSPPEGKEKDVRKIKTWMSTQSHLPEISDDYVHLFLHACYYSMEKTKSALECYFSIKAAHPTIFDSRDPEDQKLKTVLELGYLLRLPKTTPEGYRVLLYSVKDSDASKMNFNDVVKGFCMYNDVVLSEDGLQEGYIVLFDMKGVSIGHLARVSLPALKCFMYYIQDAHPCRLKAIHVLNTASWIQHVMRLIVPLTRSELLSLVRFHKGNVPEDFPIELLPMDYGGEAPTVEELDATTRELFTKYRDWLLESSQFKADESKRSKKASWWGLFGNKGPQTAELDEKTILKNLQID